MPEQLDEDTDQLHEECGVFGVWAPKRDVARLTYFGLRALQHRGQESAGIAVGDGGTVMVRKDLGLLRSASSPTPTSPRLPASLQWDTCATEPQAPRAGRPAQPHLSTINERYHRACA